MVFYIFAIGVCNFVVRFRALKNKELKLAHFKTYDSTTYQVPEKIVRWGRHFDNQFQLPLLFLITLTLAQSTPAKNSHLLISLAWGFILTRMVHTFIHLGSNNVRWRAIAYFAGWLVLLGIWAVLAFEQF